MHVFFLQPTSLFVIITSLSVSPLSWQPSRPPSPSSQPSTLTPILTAPSSLFLFFQVLWWLPDLLLCYWRFQWRADDVVCHGCCLLGVLSLARRKAAALSSSMATDRLLWHLTVHWRTISGSLPPCTVSSSLPCSALGVPAVSYQLLCFRIKILVFPKQSMSSV